jgi:hypothetical protein
MSDDFEERVRQRAHELWERAGRPEGLAEQHWEQALQQITAEAEGADSDREEGGESNLSTVAAGRMEGTGIPRAPLSPGAANSGRMAKARRKDAT